MNMHTFILIYLSLVSIGFCTYFIEDVGTTCIGLTCFDSLSLLVFLDSKDNLTYSGHGVNIDLERLQDYAALYLDHKGEVFNSYEIFEEDEMCAVNVNYGACLGPLGPQYTLCCTSPHAIDGFQRKTGQHCLGSDSEFPLQVYNVVKHKIEYQVVGTLEKDGKTYDLYWNRFENNSNNIPSTLQSIMTVQSPDSNENQLANFPFNYAVFLNTSKEPTGIENSTSFDYFFISSRESFWDKLFITDDKWISKATCNEPQYFHTKVQSINPKDQYFSYRNKTLNAFLEYANESTVLFRYPSEATHLEMSFDYNSKDIVVISMSILDIVI